jgi:hypothetical protein
MPRVVQPAFAAMLISMAAVSTPAEETAPKGDSKLPPNSTRLVSPHMAAALAAAVPKFDSVQPTAPPPEPAKGENKTPSSDDPSIVHLPKFIVNEAKLPKADEVMTEKAVAAAAMDRYLGSKDGFDRGFLNVVTIADLWHKIPLIGKILPPPFGSMTNQGRAMMFRGQDERLRKMNELLDLGTITTAGGNRAQGEQIRRETTTTFRRDPFGD